MISRTVRERWMVQTLARDRARWFTHAVCKIISHRNFSNNFISNVMKKYDLNKIILISPAPDRVRRCHFMSCQSSHGRRVISLRSFFWAFLETADQTSQRDYRPIVIGNWSIYLSIYLSKDRIYSGAKKYLVSHQLCKFSHLKRWERPVIFIIGIPQLWETK